MKQIIRFGRQCGGASIWRWFLALVSVVLLSQGCESKNKGDDGNDSDNPIVPQPEREKYLAFTYRGKNDAISGVGGKLDFSAIGGRGSMLYLGTESNKGVLYAFDLTDQNAILRTPIMLGKDGTAPGLARFNHDERLVSADQAVVSKIVPGAGDYVVAAVRGLGSTGIGNISNDGGIARVRGTQVTGAWRNRFSDMDAGAEFSGVGAFGIGLAGPAYNKTISALGVVNGNWVAFVNAADSYGTHFGLEAQAAKAVAGPKSTGPDGLIGKIVTAVTSVANDLFVAIDGQVYRIDGSNLNTAKIRLSEPLLTEAQLRFDAIPNSKKITTLAALNDQLLIGFDVAGANTGGLFIAKQDGSDLKAMKKNVGIKNIAVSPSHAMIITKNGFSIYLADTLYDVDSADAIDNFTEAAASPIKPAIIGPVGDDFAFNQLLDAAYVAGSWNMAIPQKGIFAFEVSEKSK